MYLMILSIDSERLLSDSVFLSQTQTKHSTQMHQTSRQQRHFTDSSHVLGRREGTGSAVQLDNYNKLDKDSSPHTHTHTGSLVKRKDTCTHHCVMVTGLRVVLLKASARDGWVIGQSPNNKQPCCRSQWSSGNTLACGGRERSQVRIVLQTKVSAFSPKITVIRSFRHGLHTDCSV